MSRVHRIAVCYPQVPFFRGGTELAVEALCRELKRRGHDATAVSIPFRWSPRSALMDQCLAWRMLDLEESNGLAVDQVIATKFPSYVLSHPNKVTWLFHQFRQAYDLFGTEYSDFTRSPQDLEAREMIRRIDCSALSESQRIFTLSETVSDRLRQYNGIEGKALYLPPHRPRDFHSGPQGNYVLSVGRLDAMKRVGALLDALPHSEAGLRCVIAGEGPEEPKLRGQAERLGISDRVDFLGAVSFRKLVDLYAGCLAVYFAPFQEDYGLVTLEAFLSHKPVVTAPDSGATLEFVRDDETGVVVDLDPQKLGEAFRTLANDRPRAAALGREGRAVAEPIRWPHVVDSLVTP